jgi:capsule polysaccharide export protein KpsE/RkpR
MKIAAAMLQQWHRENPARLLQAALLQAERLAQMAPELEVLRARNASLHQQLEVKTKCIAQLEAAAKLLLSVATPKTHRCAQAPGAQARASGRLPA